MVGKICLSVKQTLQDISNNQEKFEKKSSFNDFFSNADLLTFLYKQCKIDIEEYYKTCALISSKTSNNQKIVEEMEYYVFNNYMVYLEDINKTENGGNQQEDIQKSSSKQFSSSMNNAKSLMKPNFGKFKAPKH